VGWLAGVVMKEGGLGLARGLAIGVAGAIGTGVAGRVFSAGSHAGTPATAVVAFVGAAVAIIGQRRFWPAPAKVERKGRVVPRS
jgi:uncharacterized membrane protein YeaQ/YmgE (transglycosylase-associated protein family)